MFPERVNKLFEALGATSTEIARFAGCDRSLVSRLKNGGRIPKPSSVSTAKLINGIFLFADDKNLTKKLAEAVFCKNEAPSPGEIKNRILEYLYEGWEQPEKIPKPRRFENNKSISFRSFGTKLDAVMNIADLSNMRLSKMLHIDASTVSRFRNGLRSPKSNPKLTAEICDCLFSRISELGRLRELLSLAKIPAGLSEDKNECQNRFRNWLCDFETEDTSVLAEKLLENISSFSADIKLPLPDISQAAPANILNSEEHIYLGIDGIRCAVKRFLASAIRDRAKELWLYSDENMAWMTEDMDFRLAWASLMIACVRQGIKIRIIHNINRDINEMIDAINSWIPLYMSGMIEPYYLKNQNESKFATTVFLCPGHSCISGVHVVGNEENCIYRYDTDEKLLDSLKNDYKKLLDMARPLVKTLPYETEEETVYSGVTAICYTLSLATMPEGVIKSIISRLGADEDTKKEIMAEWERKTALFGQSLKNGAVMECIKPADEEMLYCGKVLADIKCMPVTYTPQEYKEHIKNIISLSENEPDYRFYALPDTAFTNINVIVSENSVSVTRLLSPKMTFVFTHPAMCEAFSGYADRLKEQYKQDKITLRRLLERYL